MFLTEVILRIVCTLLAMAEQNTRDWLQKFGIAVDGLEKLMQSQRKLFANASLDAQVKLSKLSQVISILHYEIEFEKFNSKATEIQELVLVSLFLSLV